MTYTFNYTHMSKYNLTEKKIRTPLYRSQLNSAMVEDLYQKIMTKFIVEKKYQDPDYSAQKLAMELGTNTRYISAVINLRFQDNYSQMVNEFRIKDAMYMLKDKNCHKMTMEEIALAVGFSNRQSFYAAFYKRTGQSPKEYLIENLKEMDTRLAKHKAREQATREKKKREKA